MNRGLIQRLTGLLFALASVMMLPPLAVAVVSGDGGGYAFGVSALVLFLIGVALWLPAHRAKRDISLREGFLVVVAAWTVIGLSGALPLLLISNPEMRLVDAVFESISGLTTTGATVLTGLDQLPHAVLFYRQQLQWLGGMGIIVLAVAVLPMLRIGGMQLYRAETPGPMKDSKLTPRITETAKALWYLYLGLTVLCAAGYWLAGMGSFDAVAHAFSTIAIGGFSTHDLSIGYFNSPLIELIATVFMALAGINFALHFLAWRRASAGPYLKDTELRVYVVLLLSLVGVCALYLFATGTYDSVGQAIRYGMFHAVSIATTTGFTTTAHYSWPSFLPLLLLLASFVGGCAGSTAGGIKVIRMMLIYKQGAREVRRLIHPNAHLPIKVGGKSMSDAVVNAVWGFFALYMAGFLALSVLLTATGLDLVTAISAVAACLNNLGPALGDAGASYAGLNDTAKWLLSLAMVLGRLEVFTLIVLFTPTFWRG